MDDEQLVNDMSIALQLQQFLDEWHYRVIHSNLAASWDRDEALLTAVSIIEYNGLELTPEEKANLPNLDEDKLVEFLTRRMDLQSRKSFEHFVLQLQLIISSATRCRHGLEEVSMAHRALLASHESEDTPIMQQLKENYKVASQDLGRTMEDSDKGITQQILKKCILEAADEVKEIAEIRETWLKSTEQRMGRLEKCSDEAVFAKKELAALQSQLDNFGGDQTSKSKSVLLKVAAAEDQQFLNSVFSSWHGQFMRYKAEKDIHDKFRKQIANAEDKLVHYRERQLANVRGVLGRKAADLDGNLLDDIVRIWHNIVVTQKGDLDQQKYIRDTKAKLANMQSSAIENNKKVMTRMTEGNDGALITLCWQAWDGFLTEYKKNKEMEDAVKKAEQQLADFTKRKSDEAKGVLDRMSGASDSGLQMLCFQGWRDYFVDVKQAREMEEMMMNGDARFKSLAQKQRGAANGVMGRLNETEAEIFLATFFLSWSAESSLGKIINHYTNKLDAKKSQLDGVQGMFKSFAEQLEKGVGNDPSSH